MKLPERFQVLKPFFIRKMGDRRHSIPFVELLHFLFAPGKKKRGQKWFSEFKKTDMPFPAHEVFFSGSNHGFLIPLSVDKESICTTADETFDPAHWHQYQIPQTKIGSTDYVVDAGAAEGFFALQASRVAKKVFCFEPVKEFADVLQENFKSAANVEIYPIALGDSDSTQILYLDGFASSATPREGNLQIPNIEIKVKTLDSLHNSGEIEQITYLKADVEGFEINILKGAQEVIKKFRPKIAITTYHSENNIEELESFLKGLQPNYSFLRKGLTSRGTPVMLHAW